MADLQPAAARQTAELRARLEQVEQEKRHILSSLQREREENTRKAEEIESLLKRSRDSRQEISKLTTANQQSQSQENAAKFKLQGIEQELKLTKKDAQWAHQELSKSNQAAASHRSSTRLEISSLQSDLDTTRQEVATSRTKISSLQQAYDETSSRLSQSSNKIAELQSRLATQENSFRSEISAQSQLVQLWERKAQRATTRIQELEDQWEQVLGQCREREEAAWQETANERQQRVQLEQDKAELSLALDKLAEGVGIGQERDDSEADMDDEYAMDDLSQAGQDLEVQSQTSSRRFARSFAHNGTPRATNLSNTATFASKVQQSGKTFSQVYMELAKTQEELRREKMECNRLGNVLAQVMDELQDRAPQLQAQREETDRLTQDLQEMLKQVATTSEERDQVKAEAHGLKLDLERLERENGLQSQQLADFGRQVRDLTKELIMREDPSAAARLDDDGTLLSELDAVAPIPENGHESDTQAVISSQLITFRSLSELCAQNARLIQVTRQLGDKMEEEERSYKAKLAEDESATVNEARDLIVRLEDEVRAERYKTEEVTRERDMFRHLCATGGRGASAAEEREEQQQQPANAAATLSEYEMMRNRYESLKDEHESETRRYREEAQMLRNDLGSATVSIARERASKEAIEESLTTLRRSFELQKADLDQAIKRAQSLHESLTSKNLANQAVEEQLTEYRLTAERLRTQVATLQAEKELWKGTEAKLLEENASIHVERNSLQALVSNTQVMQSELESRGQEARLRLEQDAKRLTEANEDLKSKLANEMDLYRQLSLRREVESRDLHARLDTAAAELSNAREALAIARTSADSTQLRVEDLNKQLEAAKEKLSIYERREQISRDPVGFQAAQPEVQLSREEQLEIELADLKAGRAAAQIEVQQARIQIEQSTAIATEKETQITQLKTAYEEHKTASEADLNAKNTEIAALQTQVEKLTDDLTAARTQIKTLEEQMESERKAYFEDKRSLEDAITQLGTAEDRARAEHEDVEGEIRKLVTAAKDAETKLIEFEKNNVAVTIELTEAKEQLQRVRQETGTLRSQKDMAEVEWGREKAAWESVKQGLEKGKGDLQRRIKDLSTQNQILHSHLETVSAQANQIRQAAAEPFVSAEMDVDQPAEMTAAVEATPSAAKPIGDVQPAAAAEGEPTEPAAAVVTEALKEESVVAPAFVTSVPPSIAKSRIDELHEVIKYLRKEKEIVDLQMELNKQETARLKQSLDHVNKTLDETRTQLTEERSRNASAKTTSAQHAELLEKIDELNVLRETNATLQEENDRALRRISSLEASLSASEIKLEPLESQLRTSQIELESSQAQLNLIREDNKRWQSRAQSLLQTNGIEDELKKAAEAQKEVEAAKAETETVRAELQTSKTNFEKLREQVRARIANERKAVAEAQAKVDALQKEKEEEAGKFEERVKGLEENMASLTEERDGLKVQLEAAQAAAATQPVEEGEVAPPADQASIQAAVAEAQKAWDEARTKLEAEKAEVEKMRDRHLQKGKEFLRNQRAAEAQVKAHEEMINKLKEDFVSNNAEAIQAAVDEKVAATPTAEGSMDQLQKRITELEAALTKANERVTELESNGSPDIAALQAQHAEALKSQEAELAAKLAMQHKVDVESSFLKGQQSFSGDADVESQIQARLKAFEDERENAKQASIKQAVDQVKSSMEEQLKSRFEAGKNEANLRNQLLVKQRDNRIAKLTAEVTELKGEILSAPAAATPTAPAARPGVFGRGGAQAARGTRGGATGIPTRPAAATNTSIRGAATARGGRGGATAGAKRKLSSQGTPSITETKKSRAAGGPVPLKRPQ